MSFLKGRFIQILMIVLVLVVAVIIFVYRDWVAELGIYGYLGVFLISLTSSATIILPMPSMLLIFSFGAIFNPVLVGLIAAIGGTIGEITGYILGRSGRGLMPSNKMFIRAERWMRKWGTMTIFVFALVPPLPIDIIGILVGSLRFPVWKFLLACFFGKALLYTGMAFVGAWGWESVLKYFGW